MSGPLVANSRQAVLDRDTDLEAVPASVIKILDGALQAMAARGADRLSMSDICHTSGVSRGTLYRYFASKEEVLAAVSEYVSLGFERGLLAVSMQTSDPIERLRAVLRFHAEYTTARSPDRLLEIEPRFQLTFFRSHLERHCQVLAEALDPVFDHFESQIGHSIDRRLVAECLVRLQLSRVMVPASPAWEAAWDRAPDVLARWFLNLSADLTTPDKR